MLQKNTGTLNESQIANSDKNWFGFLEKVTMSGAEIILFGLCAFIFGPFDRSAIVSGVIRRIGGINSLPI